MMKAYVEYMISNYVGGSFMDILYFAEEIKKGTPPIETNEFFYVFS